MKSFKKWRLPSKKWFSLLTLFLICGFINWQWSNILCENTIHRMFFAVVIVAQFYFSVEFSSRFVDSDIIVDFRTHEEKLEDAYEERQLLIEASKNNFLMQMQQGQISEETAKNRLEAMLNFNEQPLQLKQGELV